MKKRGRSVTTVMLVGIVIVIMGNNSSNSGHAHGKSGRSNKVVVIVISQNHIPNSLSFYMGRFRKRGPPQYRPPRYCNPLCRDPHRGIGKFYFIKAICHFIFHVLFYLVQIIVGVVTLSPQTPNPESLNPQPLNYNTLNSLLISPRLQEQCCPAVSMRSAPSF